MATFEVNLAPGNKAQTVAQVKADMGHVESGVLFTTEREKAAQRDAVTTGLGKGWKRVFDNEVTFAYGAHFTQTGKPTTRLLAKDDPSLAGVSPNRYLNRVPLKHRDGTVIAFKGTHLVSEANCIHTKVKGRAWRETTYKTQTADVLASLKRDHAAGIPQVYAGDLNTGKFFTGDQLFAALKAEFGADVTHAYNGTLDHVFLISTAKVKLTAGKPVVTKNSSDHDMVSVPVTATTVGAKPPVVLEKSSDRYDKVTFRGKTVNKITRAALLEAESRLGYELTIVQGSYHKGVGASAGTHDAGGVVDLAPFEADRKVKVLREVGFAVWHRMPIPGVWSEHVHAVLIGDKSATPVAQRQVTSYFNGRDGLAGNRVDKTWRPNPIPTFEYPPKVAPTPPKPAAKPVANKVIGHGADWSFARPDAIAMRNAGVSLVIRYITRDSVTSPSKKKLTKAEVKTLHAAGLSILLVWETTAGRAAQGEAAGRLDAHDAEAAAKALGYPKDCVILYAVDSDLTAAKVKPYFKGITAVATYPAGIYGGFKVADAGFVKWVWQTVAWSKVKGVLKVSKKAQMLQKTNRTLKPKGVPDSAWDENDIYAEMPAWKP